MIGDHWTDTAAAARNVTAGLNIATIGSLRSGNESKAVLLIWASLAQVFAVLALAIGVLDAV
jgi:hypothetical protein